MNTAEKIAILSPQMLGIKQDYPSILLKEAWIPDCKDVFFHNGEIWKYKKRVPEFDYKFPDRVLAIEYYFKDSESQWWSLYFTKRDIAYRDIVGDKFIFINKKYDAGTITVTKDSDAVVGSGTAWEENVKAGDFIALKDEDNEMHSSLRWYEVKSVNSDTSITLTEDYQGDTESGASYFIRNTFTGTEFDSWSVITFHEKLIATNNGIDPIIIWEGLNRVDDLDCPYKCRQLFVYGNRVILGYIIDGGDVYPNGWRWSGIGNEEDWGGEGSDSGMDLAIEGEGELIAFAELRGSLYLFKERGIIQAWNVESDEVFNKKLIEGDVGTQAPDSIMVIDPYIYYYCPDNTFRQFNGIKSITISDEITNIVKNLNPNFEQYIQCSESEYYGHLIWSVPYGESEINNYLLIYDLNRSHNCWGVAEMDVSCFGYYTTEAAYDWASLPYTHWVDWDWPQWDYIVGLEAFPVDLVADYEGNIHRLNADVRDLGEDYESRFQLTTDLKQLKLLPFYKRLLNIRVLTRKENSTQLNIRLKRDTEPSWQEVGSVTLESDNDIQVIDLPVDYSARNFLIEFYSNDNFQFLGVILEYVIVGDR